MSQHRKLILALVLAIICGLVLHPFAEVHWLKVINTHFLQPVGQIFLRMIFMVVVPLIFSALVIATNELARSRGLSRVFGKTLIYTVIISTLSVIIGISLVNTIKPGTNFVFSEAQQKSLATNLGGPSAGFP